MPVRIAILLAAMRALLLSVLFVYCAAAAANDGRPVGTNCTLKVPPADAGEDAFHGITMKIYPRAKDISNKYSGCQIMWIPHDGKWHVSSIVAIERGDAVRVWTPDKSDKTRACRYKEGKVVKGDPQKCAATQFLIAKSLPAGCVERTGAAGERPADCKYE
jgi:hypothetical protein